MYCCRLPQVQQTTLDDNGFQTLLLLREQFGRTRRQTMMSTLMRVVLQNFDENNFIEQLTKWEFDISEYERVSQGKTTRAAEDHVADQEDQRSNVSLLVQKERRLD